MFALHIFFQKVSILCKQKILHHAELKKRRGNNWEYTGLKTCEACRQVKPNQTKTFSELFESYLAWE